MGRFRNTSSPDPLLRYLEKKESVASMSTRSRARRSKTSREHRIRISSSTYNVIMHPNRTNAPQCISPQPHSHHPSNILPDPMIRTPNAPHTLIRTPHRLDHPPQLLPISIPQQLGLLQDLLLLQIPHAHGLLPPVDVCPLDDRVPVRPWRDGDFDLWVRGCEAGERVAEEGTLAGGGGRC